MLSSSFLQRQLLTATVDELLRRRLQQTVGLGQRGGVQGGSGALQGTQGRSPSSSASPNEGGMSARRS